MATRLSCTFLPLIVSLSAIYYLLVLHQGPAHIYLPTFLGGVIGSLPSALGMWWIATRLPVKLRNHPLVQDGQALYGGVAALRVDRVVRGYLFITRDSLHFYVRSAGWSAGETVSYPLSSITSVTRQTRLGIPMPGLVLTGPSLGVVKLGLTRPLVWKKAILAASSVPV